MDVKKAALYATLTLLTALAGIFAFLLLFVNAETLLISIVGALVVVGLWLMAYVIFRGKEWRR